MAEDGVEPESDEASGQDAASKQALPTRRSASFAHQALDLVHTALSAVVTAVVTLRPGLYIFEKEYCQGTMRRIYREHVGDVPDRYGFVPRSAYAIGETYMWAAAGEIAVAAADESTQPGEKVVYNTLSIDLGAAQHV
jgi:hypothetical protein